MRHAYIINAFNNFKVLEKLLLLLDDPRNTIYLHIDKKVNKFNESDFAPLVNRATLVFVPRSVVNWAGYSHIAIALHLLKCALKADFDYCHLLSCADFPIKTQDEIDAFFTKNAGKEFIDFAPENYAFAKYKCHYYHFFVDNRYYRHNMLLKILNHGVARAQRFLRLRRAQPEIKHGSTWFSITRDLAQYVVQNEEKIRKGFRFTLSADECFLQTLVYHSPFLARVNQFEQKYVGNARFIDWTRRAGNSPYTFRLDDFEDLMSRGEGLCFARKFDEILDFPVVEKIFDRLSHTAFAPR